MNKGNGEGSGSDVRKQIADVRQTRLDLFQQAMNEGGCVGAIDFPRDVEGIAVLGFGYDLVRKRCRKRPVRAFFFCPGIMSGRKIYDTQHRCVDAFVDTQLVLQTLCRTCAMAVSPSLRTGRSMRNR